jgi:hypothetical protein
MITDVRLDFRELTAPLIGCDIQEQRFIGKLATNTFLQRLTISKHVEHIELSGSFNGINTYL